MFLGCSYKVITADDWQLISMNSAAVAMRAPSMRSSGLICRALAQGVHTRMNAASAVSADTSARYSD